MQSESIINSLNKSLTSESDDEAFNEFTTRIQTYIDEQKWIKKPSALSPPICSQYGWKCIKSDLLECVTCGAKLSVNEPKIGNYEAYKACVRKTMSNLKENHGKHCPWPLTLSPESFMKMTLISKEEALSQFLKRLESSVSYQSFFPKIKETVISDLGFNDQQIISLCKMAGVNTEEASNFGKSIVPLSATGWIVIKELESNKCVLKCNNCLRSVWCGSFSLLDSKNSLKVEGESNETDIPDTNSNIVYNDCEDSKENSDEPPAKRKRISFAIKTGEPFDPLHEHRPWCLWIHNGVGSYTSRSIDNAADKATENASNIPGWKVFLKSLLRNISDNQTLEVDSPSREQIRNVKNLLEKWTDAV